MSVSSHGGDLHICRASADHIAGKFEYVGNTLSQQLIQRILANGMPDGSVGIERVLDYLVAKTVVYSDAD